MDKSIYPSDGVYYFEDGGTRLKAEVKNTPTQLRIRLIDDPPYLIYISFHVDNDTLKNLDDRTYYPIAELCGEEE